MDSSTLPIEESTILRTLDSSNFRYSDIPDFIILLDHFTKLNIDYSLHSFIKEFLEYTNSVKYMEYYDLSICDKNMRGLIESIYYLTDISDFIFNIEVSFYDFELDLENKINKKENQEFKNWCDNFDKILKKNSKKEKAIQKIIRPFQKGFLERLFNPNEKIGKQFATKKMNALPWAIL